MAIQYNAGSGAGGCGLNLNLSTITGLSWNSNDDVLRNAFKSNTGDPSTGGIDFVNDLITSGDLFNNDTGSVRGTDAGLGNTPINEQDSVPDATGAPTSNYKEAEDDNPDPIIIADGKTLELNTIGTLNFGDSSTYDLTSENGATCGFQS